MTEREILEKQEENGNQAFYLVQKGIFYDAYGHGAFALARATGYKVMKKHRKAGDIVQAGFGVQQLNKVIGKIEEAGGSVEMIDDKTFVFSGIDGTPDESMVQEPESNRCKALPPNRSLFHTGEVGLPIRNIAADDGVILGSGYAWLAMAVSSFPLSSSTPLDAMQFIGDLQRKIKDCNP